MRYWLVMLLIVTLLGCSSSPFYSPNKLVKYEITDFPHQVSDFYLQSLSGNALHFQYHFASESFSQRPLVVHFHGNSGNLSQTIEKVSWLMDYGFNVLVFDYSGYGKSEGKASRHNLHADAVFALRYIADRWSSVDKVIIGTSMGGAIVSAALPESGQESAYRLLILDSTFDNYIYLARDVVKSYPFGFVYSWLADVLISDELSPAHEIKKLTRIPVIISHCINDGLIPITRGLSLYQHIPTEKLFKPLADCRHARGFVGDQRENQFWLVGQMKNVINHAGQVSGNDLDGYRFY